MANDLRGIYIEKIHSGSQLEGAGLFEAHARLNMPESLTNTGYLLKLMSA